MYMQIISDALQIEYQTTSNIFHTSSNMFCVFNDLNIQHEPLSLYFLQTFDTLIHTNPHFKDPCFSKLLESRSSQMSLLSEALRNVHLSTNSSNLFYHAFC